MPPGINSQINSPNQNVTPRREHRSFEVPDMASQSADMQGSEHYPPQPRGFIGAPPEYDMQGSEGGPHRQPQQQQYTNPHREEFDRQRRQEAERHRSEDTARIEAEMASLRRQKATGNTPISSFGRERMEYLAGLGRIRKDIVVDGTTFSLQTLKAREMREAVKAVTNVPKLEIVFEARRQELAYAIYRVDGIPIEQVVGTDDINVRLDWVEDMDLAMQKYLHAELGEMDKQSATKYSIKTTEQLKEVIEDAKK